MQFAVEYFNKIILSYYENTNHKCCPECIKRRLLNTRKDRKHLSQYKFEQRNEKEVMFNKLVFNIMEELKTEEKLVDEFDRRKVVVVDKNTMEISTNYINPVPDCPNCAEYVSDTEEETIKDFKTLLENLNSGEVLPFRSGSLADLKTNIEKIFLNKDFGIITTLLDNYECGPFPIAIAMLPLENGMDEPGTGRTCEIENSRAVALLEAVERYAGFYPKGKKTVVYDTYNHLMDLNKEVIDIHELIINAESISNTSQYKNEKFFFNADEKYHWVYGYNLTNQTPVLVPETLAYYGMILKDESYKKELFTYEISNGCSVGASLLEASYYGLLEDIERDAFLTSWYTDRDIIKLILNEEFWMSDSKLKSEIEIFENYYSDYRLDIYEISADINIPVVMMTVTKKVPEKEKMNFMCATAADATVFKAAEKAMHEISSIFVGLQEKFGDNYTDIKEKAENLKLVKDMSDHSLVFGYYKSLEKIHFHEQAVREIVITEYENESKVDDICSQYRYLIEECDRLDKKIIVVNQTTEEMKKIDLYCTKTLVPGLLPMTFGSDNIRISDKRIREMEKLNNRKLNVRFEPHPFP